MLCHKLRRRADPLASRPGRRKSKPSRGPSRNRIAAPGSRPIDPPPRKEAPPNFSCRRPIPINSSMRQMGMRRPRHREAQTHRSRDRLPLKRLNANRFAPPDRDSQRMLGAMGVSWRHLPSNTAGEARMRPLSNCRIQPSTRTRTTCRPKNITTDREPFARRRRSWTDVSWGA